MRLFFKKYPLLLFLTGSIAFMQSFSRHTEKSPLHEYYRSTIDSLQKEVDRFRDMVRGKAGQSALKQQLLQSRLAYKKLAIFTEYFNPLETGYLNAPALDRLVADDPDSTLAPTGFQALEAVLYGEWKEEETCKQAEQLLAGIHFTLQRLEKEPDQQYKFKPVLVWDALRAAVLNLITRGITGADSPSALQSLTEATGTLEGLKAVLPFLKESCIREEDNVLLQSLINKCQVYLEKNNAFNRFNRLDFITGYADPLYRTLNTIRLRNQIGFPDGSNPLQAAALSVFDSDAFNIDYFSPSPEYRPTPARAELGKKLFYDNLLSGTKTRNCGSCHLPEKAFADGLKTPLALDDKTPLLRNSPTLLNAVFQTRLFYDSRVDMLEGQLSRVIHDTKEMRGSLEQSVQLLNTLPEYKELFRKAYPAEAMPLNTFTITNAVASYIRTLTALNSRFDQYMRGDPTRLSAAEKRGFNLFAGKAKCATCHYIPLFNGLVPPVFNETESEVLGVPAGLSKQNPQLDADPGKYGFTRALLHQYAFKTPTLRNIALTAPYMHNGVFNTLEEVMEFYNRGGGQGLGIAPPNQTLPFEKLNLSRREIRDIIAFMKALTDNSPAQKN